MILLRKQTVEEFRRLFYGLSTLCLIVGLANGQGERFVLKLTTNIIDFHCTENKLFIIVFAIVEHSLNVRKVDKRLIPRQLYDIIIKKQLL